MKRKLLFILGWLGLWFLCLMFVVSYVYNRAGISLSIFGLDILNGFSDAKYMFVPYHNKILLMNICFAVVLLVGVVTESYTWNIKIWKKRVSLSNQTKGYGIALCVILVVLLIADGIQLQKCLRNGSAFEPGWEGDLIISHAGGGFEAGEDYTNSLEAFEYSYQAGVRTIEMDFCMTLDGKMVCWHYNGDEYSERSNPEEMKQEEFMKIKVYDKYTPLSLEDVFELMQKYEDVYVVTDTKNTDIEDIDVDFQIIVNTAKKMDCMDVLDRMVVQLYNHEMYAVVESIHHFPNYILTLYLTGGYKGQDFIDHCRFCKNYGIKGITMWEHWASAENVAAAKRYGLDVYVHTVNDVDVIDEDRAIGVRGFYTDFVYPEMIY